VSKIVKRFNLILYLFTFKSYRVTGINITQTINWGWRNNFWQVSWISNSFS